MTLPLDDTPIDRLLLSLRAQDRLHPVLVFGADVPSTGTPSRVLSLLPCAALSRSPSPLPPRPLGSSTRRHDPHIDLKRTASGRERTGGIKPSPWGHEERAGRTRSVHRLVLDQDPALDRIASVLDPVRDVADARHLHGGERSQALLAQAFATAFLDTLPAATDLRQALLSGTAEGVERREYAALLIANLLVAAARRRSHGSLPDLRAVSGAVYGASLPETLGRFEAEALRDAFGADDGLSDLARAWLSLDPITCARAVRDASFAMRFIQTDASAISALSSRTRKRVHLCDLRAGACDVVVHHNAGQAVGAERILRLIASGLAALHGISPFTSATVACAFTASPALPPLCADTVLREAPEGLILPLVFAPDEDALRAGLTDEDALRDEALIRMARA